MQTTQKNKKSREGGVSRVRMAVVFFLMLLFGIFCLGQICYLSFFERGISTGKSSKCVDTTDPNWKEKEESDCRCYILANPLQPERGDILDDQGRLLMGNYTVFEVAFDGKKFAKEYDNTNRYTKEEVETLLHNLAKSFYQRFHDRYPKTEQEYYAFFKNNYRKQQYASLLTVNLRDEKSWVTSFDTSYIRNLPFLTRKVMDKETEQLRPKKYYGYLNCVPTSVRVNPYGEMARRTLGMNAVGNAYGLEYIMDSILGGVQGSKKYLEINKAKVPFNEQIEPVDGMNIHTTLNLDIQNVVHNELHRKLVELGADWGCVIVMETETGAIKAISNLRRASSDGQTYTESMEYALNAKVEPGSTFKLASLLAYFERTPVDTAHFPMFNHTFRVPTKSGRYIEKAKSDSKVHGETPGLSNEIFQRSSNIGVASMIFKAYGMGHFSEYRKQLAKFGFFDTVQTQLGPILPAAIRNDGRFDNYYAVCFGAGFTMPVLRTLMYYNAIANNGKMMKPFIVKYITNTYDTVRTFEPEVVMEQFVSDTIVQKARAYLDSVVWGRYGTGRRYKDSTCPFAGKTGTRDVWDEKTGQYVYDRNAVSFCGYFPKENPKYTAVIYMYNVLQHSEVAVDLFGKIARGIMNSHNFGATRSITKFERQPIPRIEPVEKRYFNVLLHEMGYDTTVTDAQSRYMISVKTKGEPQPQLQGWAFKQQDKMPDVRNMLASDAVAELTRAGYRVQIQGRGRVKNQTVDASAKTVRLYLEP
ncbi:MAG: hypothetical protein IK013_04505 [Bacteroidales bacterium]|nr:hypothetical protein [Bacteroidales bacterium]